LTAHLEQELTLDDVHDEVQKELMLREFEDKENLLTEMESQVDTYREVGKVNIDHVLSSWSFIQFILGGGCF